MMDQWVYYMLCCNIGLHRMLKFCTENGKRLLSFLFRAQTGIHLPINENELNATAPFPHTGPLRPQPQGYVTSNTHSQTCLVRQHVMRLAYEANEGFCSLQLIPAPRGICIMVGNNYSNDLRKTFAVTLMPNCCIHMVTERKLLCRYQLKHGSFTANDDYL